MVMTGRDGAPIVQVALDYVSRKRLRHYEVVGDLGGLLWDIGGTLERVTPSGRETLLDVAGGFDVAASYVAMLDAISAVQAGGDWPFGRQTLPDGVTITRVALAARDQGSKRESPGPPSVRSAPAAARKACRARTSARCWASP